MSLSDTQKLKESYLLILVTIRIYIDLTLFRVVFDGVCHSVATQSDDLKSQVISYCLQWWLSIKTEAIFYDSVCVYMYEKKAKYSKAWWKLRALPAIFIMSLSKEGFQFSFSIFFKVFSVPNIFHFFPLLGLLSAKRPPTSAETALYNEALMQRFYVIFTLFLYFRYEWFLLKYLNGYLENIFILVIIAATFRSYGPPFLLFLKY